MMLLANLLRKSSVLDGIVLAPLLIPKALPSTSEDMLGRANVIRRINYRTRSLLQMEPTPDDG